MLRIALGSESLPNEECVVFLLIHFSLSQLNSVRAPMAEDCKTLWTSTLVDRPCSANGSSITKRVRTKQIQSFAISF
jgi:hypothetical protein